MHELIAFSIRQRFEPWRREENVLNILIKIGENIYNNDQNDDDERVNTHTDTQEPSGCRVTDGPRTMIDE